MILEPCRPEILPQETHRPPRERPVAPRRMAILALLLVAVVGCHSAPDPAEPATPRSSDKTAAAVDPLFSSDPVPREMNEDQRRRQLESFELVWRTIQESHWDATLGGLDWQGIHDELRPKAERARSVQEMQRIIRNMIGRLQLSHHALIPAAVYIDPEQPGSSTAAPGGDLESPPVRGQPGFDLRVHEGAVLVTEVQPGSPADDLGIQAGWRILRLADTPVADLLGRLEHAYARRSSGRLLMTMTLLGFLGGAVGERVAVVFADGDDIEHALEIPLAPPRGTLTRFGAIEAHCWFEDRELEGGVGYIRFNRFLGERLMDQFESAVERYRRAPGIIVDLRGSPGGISLFAAGLAGWFLEFSSNEPEGIEFGVMKLRDNEMTFVAFRRSDAYRGKLAILIDGCSASTAEIMASGLRDIGRARLFGSRSAGATLSAVSTRLPSGDGFQYATATYVTREGKTLEGQGVQPDEPVALTRKSLLAGKDPVVEAASRWIRNEEKIPN